MAYHIAKQTGTSVAVPQLVFSRLDQLKAEDLKVALCLLESGSPDAGAIAARLGLPVHTVEISLAFWAGAGLLGTDGEIAPPVAQRMPRLTAKEVVACAQQDENISLLVHEAQNILGRTLSPSESAVLVTLYAQDKLPIDMILPVMSHYAARGKREVRYLEKILLSWREEGVCDGHGAERRLAILEKREGYEQEVAGLLGMKEAGFTAGERTLIARWYEDFGYDRTMIEAASLRAGDKRTVRYISGILKKWHAAGYRTPAQLPAEGANLQPTGRRAQQLVGAAPRRAGKKSGILVPRELEDTGL